MFDPFEADRQNLLDAAARSPVPSVGTSAVESFGAAFNANLQGSGALAQGLNRYDFVQQQLDGFEARTGERIANPLGIPRTIAPQPSLDDVRARFAEKGETFPSDDEITQGAVGLAQQALSRQARAAAAPQSLGARISGIAGGLSADTLDPINAAAVATIPEGGLAVKMLGAAASFGGSTLASDLATYGFKRRVDPDFGPGSVVKDTALAAATGAGFELGGAAIGAGARLAAPYVDRSAGALWRRIKGTEPALADAMPTELADAGNAAERVADLQANNPFGTGHTGEAAHNEAVVATERDMLAGNDPVLPQAAAQESASRLGQVFTPGVEMPAREAPASLDEAALPQAFYASGSVRVRYELAEAADLVTSHDGDFNVNPAYPTDLQPRNRAGLPARDQVYAMAADLQPERLGPNVEANSGAPIVGPDNVVESGNGRTMAVRMAYEDANERAGAYRAFLERSGYDTDGFAQPVLVARRMTPMAPEERAAFSHAANGSAALRMGATEQGLSDARHIGPDEAALLKPGDVSAARNRDFVRAFVSRLPEGERGSVMAADGTASAAGLQRLRAALVARAYGDRTILARAFEHADPNIKTIAGALTDAAPDWIAMRDAVTAGDMPAGRDITADVAQAVHAIMRARDGGEKVADILHQGDLFTSDVTPLAARMFFRDANMERFLPRSDMAANLSTFARQVRSDVEAGETLFGEAPPSAAERLQGVVGEDARTAADQAGAAQPEPSLDDWKAAAKFNTLDDLLKVSPANQARLAAVAEQIARDTGTEFLNPGPKTAESAARKFAAKRYDGPGHMTDLVRGGFKVETPDAADAAIGALREHFPVIDEGWVTTPAGYADRKALVRFEDGQIGEVQFWNPDMLAAKQSTGHALYEEYRKLPIGDPRRDGLQQEMREVYAGARSRMPADWNAVLGSEGTLGNVFLKTSGERTLADMDTSASSTRSQEPLITAQASVPEMTQGRPSQEQAVSSVPGIAPPTSNILSDPFIRNGIRDATTPDAVEAAATAPATRNAAEASLQRDISRGRNRVPVVDDAGNVTLGYADAELQAINSELAAARAIGACNTPTERAAA